LRHPAFRLRKYEAKMDPDSIKQRFLDQKDAMVEQEEAIFGEIVLTEAKCKVVCEAAGVPSIAIPGYLNFARQCYRYFKNFSQVTRENEILNWFNHWVSRGLNGVILANVAELCGITIPGYEAPPE